MNYWINVFFKELRILNGGDGSNSDDWGEIGFEIRVNGIAIAHRWGHEISSIKNGESIPLNISHEVGGNDPKLLSAIVDWRVWDVDDFADDDVLDTVIFTFDKPLPSPTSQSPVRMEGVTPSKQPDTMQVPHKEVIRKRKTFDAHNPFIDAVDMDIELVMFVESMRPFGEVVIPKKNKTNGLTGIILYDHPLPNSSPFLKNRSQQFLVGSYNLPAPIVEMAGPPRMITTPLEPGTAEAVRVGIGYWAEAFSEQNFLGDRLIIEESMNRLPSGWNNHIKSVRVHKVFVV